MSVTAPAREDPTTRHDDEALLDEWPTIDLGLENPHFGRVLNYLQDGITHFVADRELAGRIIGGFPDARVVAWEHRYFTERAVHYLAVRGIRQFLDIGAGIPHTTNLHEIAQRVAPTSRVVYLDNDPIVMALLQSVMVSGLLGTVGVARGDLADPEGILATLAAEGTLDFGRPIALCLNAVVDHLSDEQNPQLVIAELAKALAPGSALMLTHAASDLRPQATDHVAFLCRQAGVPFYPRPCEQVDAFFDGWDLADPGVTTTSRWRPTGVPSAVETACYAGVAVGRNA